jgi:hypothetical protein
MEYGNGRVLDLAQKLGTVSSAMQSSLDPADAGEQAHHAEWGLERGCHLLTGVPVCDGGRH